VGSNPTFPTNSMKFAIITPTILRPSLKLCCYTVEAQTTPWKHLVVVDQPKNSLSEEEEDLLMEVAHPDRIVSFCDKKHMNFGNTCRASVWEETRDCDYVLYIDDDDTYLPAAFEKLAAELERKDRPVWGTYPIMFLGKRYHKLPAQTGNTFCVQITHVPEKDGWIFRFPDQQEQVYSADGLLVDGLNSLYPHTELETDPIVEVKGVSGGYPRFIRVRKS
jgi:hypothetical protein